MILALPLLAACPVDKNPPKKKLAKAPVTLRLNIKEPSDVCLGPDGACLFIVSDNGQIYKTDLNGTVLLKSPFEAYDLEAVYYNAEAQQVMAVDERTRMVHILDAATLAHIRSVEVSYPGGRNKGFESLTFHAKKGKYLLITEKEPKIIFELAADFSSVYNRTTLKGYPSDISSATYYDGMLYILSDEEHCILKVNPDDYQILDRWEIPVLNPEGISFTKEGQLIVVSDDLAEMYIWPASSLQ